MTTLSSILAIATVVWMAYQIYLYIYFRSDGFLQLKEVVSCHVEDCNALNDHIAELKSEYTLGKFQDHGKSSIVDTSLFNFKREEWAKTRCTTWTHNCSSTVVKNAHNQPFKYLCKYFDISANEETLEQIQCILNDSAAAEQGKLLLLKEREDVVASIGSSIPFIVKALSKKRLDKELGFNPVDLRELYTLNYSFQYVSAGGKSSFNCNIALDTGNLELFSEYINDLVKRKSSITGQRALMTTRLRELIKNRDNYTCQQCGLSTNDEKNLLLEIDHIVPLSRGGITTENNLQTLCWRCNRKKGSKLNHSTT